MSKKHEDVEDNEEEAVERKGDKLLKFKLIYLPFLYISVSFISIYLFLYWLIVLELGLLKFNSIFSSMLLSLLLPYLLIPVLMKDRIGLLKLDYQRKIAFSKMSYKDDSNFLWLMISALAVFFPIMFAQMYIDSENGEITRLSSINQLNKIPITKYYKIDNYSLDYNNQKETYDYYKIKLGGRERSIFEKPAFSLNFTKYIVVPIVSNLDDSLNNDIIFWSTSSISDSYIVPVDELIDEDSYYYKFVTSSSRGVVKLAQQIYYFERLDSNYDSHHYYETIYKSGRYNKIIKPIVLVPHYEKYETKNRFSTANIYTAFIIGQIIMFFMIIIPKLLPKNLEEYSNKKRNKYFESFQIKQHFNWSIPTKSYTATKTIAGINIMLYFLMTINDIGFVSISEHTIINFGAITTQLITNGEFWRLITNLFLNDGIISLIMHLYGLCFIGLFLEPVLGTKRFLLTFFLIGIFSGMFSYLGNEQYVSYSSAGTILGLFAIYYILFSFKFFGPNIEKSFLVSAVFIVILYFTISATGTIDYASLIGGITLGIIFGFAWTIILKVEKHEMEVEDEVQGMKSHGRRGKHHR